MNRVLAPKPLMERRGEVNPADVRADLIVLARESRGLTQSKLAALLGLSQGHLSKIEAGLLPVSSTVLDGLVEVLHYPPAFFTQSERLYGPGASEFFHRKRQSLSTRVLSRVHAEIDIRRIHVSRLLQAVTVDEEAIPEFDPDTFPGGAAEVARAVRAAWIVPKGPVQNLTQLIEDAGGIVIPTAFGTQLLDALGRYVPAMPPLFFTNRDAPTDRTRLTLAHELGHMVMHHVPNADMEAQAFDFAAEFLMPAREIRAELSGSLYLDKLVGLKLRWKVSMQALLRRAQHLGTIDERRARYLWMLMGKSGFRVREPAEADLLPEQPRLLARMLEIHSSLGYSESDLSDLLALCRDEFREKYGPLIQRIDSSVRPRPQLVT
jgi:Zn-dependent peptidase ImmA (M78 family)/transcriptional regulator with XRE-family HTH domain